MAGSQVLVVDPTRGVNYMTSSGGQIRMCVAMLSLFSRIMHCCIHIPYPADRGHAMG